MLFRSACIEEGHIYIGTSPEVIEERVAKAAHELTYAPLFDRVLTNDDLERCYEEFYSIVSAFLSED